jgi:uncharacterized protein (TIGR03437 family)
VWQRSPFQLSVSGGAGIIETAGIDYILPYWMARYYGLQESTVVASAAAAVAVVAPGSLASIYGSSLASTTQWAFSLPLPSSLGGISITVQDAGGNSARASLLYVSPGQINFLMPQGMPTGVATFLISNGTNTSVTAIGAVGQVAPTLFTMTGTVSGLAAATALSISHGSPATSSPVPLFNCSSSACQPCPSTCQATLLCT